MILFLPYTQNCFSVSWVPNHLQPGSSNDCHSVVGTFGQKPPTMKILQVNVLIVKLIFLYCWHEQANMSNRACHIFLFFKFQYCGVFFWCIFMCRTNVRKYIFFKNAFFPSKFHIQIYKGIGSKIQREMNWFGFLLFMPFYGILWHMPYDIKCHQP